ncbi:ATP-binding cassette domain-containing protein [Bacillus testis]|uniref:ATP-binding cassette domain-containing protein n=1 Tax=Bacillus testis TaxID=1622072 RepID=UPI00067E8D2D|nr:ATP-binding cassette domain-containing protein [Bacillus testis]
MNNIILKAKGISKSFPGKQIIKNGELTILKGDRIGLVGWNGEGKTTFFQMLLGQVEPDEGEIVYESDHPQIGYLPQAVVQSREGDLWSNEFARQLSRFGLQQEALESLDMEHASGGEKVKLALSAILQKNPELLLLDEPTNHLDAKGMQWLEEQLSSYAGAVLLISHDRYFLDQTVNEIVELNKGKLTVYTGTYSDYAAKKREERQHHQKAYDKQQKHIGEIQSQIDHLSRWAAKAHREQGKKGFAAEIKMKESDGVRKEKRSAGTIQNEAP